VTPSRDFGPVGRARIHRYHRNHAAGVLTVPESNDSGLLFPLVAAFLADLAHANRSWHTRRAYATDLAQLSAVYRGPVGGITAEVIRGFGATLERLGPASRAPKQSALASFLDWARRQRHVASDPMASGTRVRPDPPSVLGPWAGGSVPEGDPGGPAAGSAPVPPDRKRLGHNNLHTTLRYAEQSDSTADAEVRAWRRKQYRSG
jgi:hypothetical protein